MSTLTITPGHGVAAPPAEEYESVSSWLAAWPPYSTVVMTDEEGRVTLATPEDIIDGIANAPLYRSLLGIPLDPDSA